MLSPNKTKKIMRDVELQLAETDMIALDKKYSWEIVECDSVEVIAGANTGKENMDT